MTEATLHFRIALDEEAGHLDGPLRREIMRRWPLTRPGIATLEIVHGQEGFALEIDGWPGCSGNIRRFLLGIVARVRRAAYPFAAERDRDALEACVDRRATPLPDFAEWARRAGLVGGSGA